jgi:RNA polymerase sigma factor (sigma-70 family)
LTPGSRGPCSCRVCPGGEFPDKIPKLSDTLKNNNRLSERNYPEKLILDFSRYIVSRINFFRYQKYGIDQDDLLQNIYLRIFKVFEKNDKNIKAFKSYISRIVDTVVIDAIKSSRKETEALKELNQNLIDVQGHSFSNSPSPSDGLKEILLSSLDGLKESQRFVISMYLSGMDLDEIAELRKWTLGKTKNMYYRGLKDLKKRLEIKGVFNEN